jgi:hypothetical protein
MVKKRGFHKIRKHKEKGPTTMYGFNYNLLGMKIPLYEDIIEKYMREKNAEKRKEDNKAVVRKGEKNK